MDERHRQAISHRIDNAAMNPHHTDIGAMHAGKNFDEGGFARAIAAEQRMHLARPDLTVDIINRTGAAEMLGDAAHADDSVLPDGCVIHADLPWAGGLSPPMK